MPTNATYAQLADAVYQDNPANMQLPQGWSFLRPSDPNLVGYDGAAFKNNITGEIVVAHRGTEPLTFDGDWTANFQMGTNQLPAQYQYAQQFLADVIAANPGASISITGHSLGGALAQLTAAETGLPATTFNAYGARDLIPALNNQYGLQLDPNAAYGNITNHQTLLDPVSRLPGSNHLGNMSTHVAPSEMPVFGLAQMIGRIPPISAAVAGGWSHGIGRFGEIYSDPAKAIINAGMEFGLLINKFEQTITDALTRIDAAISASQGAYRIVYYDPLVLDLDGDGVETVASNGLNGLLFDQNGDGIRTATGWASADDGLLVRDLNGNGTVDSGVELFGDSTALTAGGMASNGFAALADMDSNGDGVVDAADANYAQLQIWRDLNQDGVSDAGELFSLQQLGIQSLNVSPSSNASTATVGGTVAATGSFTRTDGSAGNMADINFTQDTLHTRYTTQIAVPVALQNLPNVSGMGRLRDLQQAAALSPALANALTAYSAATTSIERKALLGSVLLEWAKTDPLYTANGVQTYSNSYSFYDPNSSNVVYLRPGSIYVPSTGTVGGVSASQDVVDKVRVVDAIRGRDVTTNIYGPNAAQGMLDAYNIIADSFYISLEQVRLQPLFDQINIKQDSNGFALDLSGVQTAFEARIALNVLSGLSDLLIFNKIAEAQGVLKGTDWTLRSLALFDSTMTSTPMTPELQAVLTDYGLVVVQTGLGATGTAQSEFVIGAAQGDVLNGGGGNDILLGGGGDDTVNAGTGNDTISGGVGNDTITDSDGSDTLDGGAGDDTISDQGRGTNTLRGGAGNDTINYSYYSSNTIEGGSGDDVIKMDYNYYSHGNYANIIEGGTGNDIIKSGASADTYRYNRGDGQDTISDYGYGYYAAAGNDKVEFGAGITSGDLFISRSGYNLVVKINDPNPPSATDRITLENWFSADEYKIESFTFADGTSLSSTQLTEMAGTVGNDNIIGSIYGDTLNGLDGNDVIRGNGGGDTLDSGLGNDVLIGGSGNDTITTGNGADIIVFNKWDGQDVVNGGVGADNTISLGGGINYADLALSKVNNDLVLETGGGDQLTLANWYDTTANYKNVIDLQVMAEAIAGFDRASADTLLNRSVQNFDFTNIVNAFDQANGGSATYLHWSATNSLLAAHLSGSDTAALGGDLAYQYGMGNTALAGIGPVSTQDVLAAPQFGVQAQTLRPLQGLAA